MVVLVLGVVWGVGGSLGQVISHAWDSVYTISMISDGTLVGDSEYVDGEFTRERYDPWA